MFLEKVNGEYQGAAMAFRSGFQSGIIRLSWLKDGSLAVGESNRGWGSAGEATMGIQRLEWNNDMPFEMKAIRAKSDGFEIEFTKPVDRKSAEDLASYAIEGWTYKYHGVYGSPPVAVEKCPVVGVKVSDDGLKARLIVNNMRKSYIHTVTIEGVREKEHFYSLVHPTAYYTLNNIPSGTKLTGSGISRRNSALAGAPNTPGATTTNRAINAAVSRETDAAKTAAKTTTAAKSTAKTAVATKVPTYKEVEPLLQKNTCLACHSESKRLVGPAYVDVAKRKYSVAQIVALIKNPKPEHWPDYSTPMPPMPQVSNADATKIAQWIRSLAK